MHFGPKHLIDNIKSQVNENKQTILEQLKIADNSLLTLQNHITEMEIEYQSKLERKESELQASRNRPDKIVEVPVIEERIVEKPVEIIREVRVEVPTEVIREVKVVEEKIIEKLVDRVVEVIVEKPVEVLKSYIPIWLIILPILQAAFEAYLLLKP